MEQLGVDTYLIVKVIHIVSSTILFGTGIGTAFQMVWAMRTKDPKTIADVSSGVVVADWIFTTPAGIIQPLTGFWLIWRTEFAREAGAVIGLSIGYVTKYLLDRRYVFRDEARP